MKHKKLFLAVVMVVLLSITTVGTVFAETQYTTRDKINSKGKIPTSSPDVIFDSDDFKTLADEIDDVKGLICTNEFFGETVSVPSNGEKYCDIPISTQSGYIVASVTPIATNASISIVSVTNTSVSVLIKNGTNSYINVEPLLKCAFIKLDS